MISDASLMEGNAEPKLAMSIRPMLTSIPPVFSVDVTNSQIIFDFAQSQSYTGSTPANGFWGWDVVVPDSPAIAGITLNPASDNFDTVSRLTLDPDGHGAHFNFNGLAFTSTDRLIFDVLFA